MIIEDNFFAETILPKSIIRKLSNEEMGNYWRLFKNKEDRPPTLIVPREIPVEGEPDAIVNIIEAYGKWASNNKKVHEMTTIN